MIILLLLFIALLFVPMYLSLKSAYDEDMKQQQLEEESRASDYHVRRPDADQASETRSAEPLRFPEGTYFYDSHTGRYMSENEWCLNYGADDFDKHNK